MAFGIGTGANPGDIPAGIVKGKQIRVACECWCTSTGKITPLMLKVQDEDGEIRAIREDHGPFPGKETVCGDSVD